MYAKKKRGFNLKILQYTDNFNAHIGNDTIVDTVVFHFLLFASSTRPTTVRNFASYRISSRSFAVVDDRISIIRFREEIVPLVARKNSFLLETFDSMAYVYPLRHRDL